MATKLMEYTDNTDNDDIPVGRILSRREVLALLGVAGASLVAGCATGGLAPASSGTVPPTPAAEATVAATVETVALPTCVVRPEMTEGPYFVDEQLNRSDIRTEPSDGSVKEGVPLALAFRVSQVTSDGCTPLAGATVDVWHCDALGIYSGVSDNALGVDTTGQKFLRGYQVTDENGSAQFMTIFPGWYTGRTVHIHFKVRTTTPANESYEFTSQLYIDDALTDQVFTQEPYAAKGERDTTNATDMHFANGGDQLLLALTEADEGFSATFDIALDLSDADTGAADSFQQGGGGPSGARQPGG